MKCELIFYLAGRTGQLEELLEELLGGLGVIIAEVTAATSPEELAAALEKGVSRRNLLLVVGGLSRPDERNAARQAAKLLSQPLSSVNPPVFRNGVSLTADHGRPEGFFLESGRQSLLLLPDDPGAVEALFDRQVTELLQKKYGLSLAVGRLEQRRTRSGGPGSFRRKSSGVRRRREPQPGRPQRQPLARRRESLRQKREKTAKRPCRPFCFCWFWRWRFWRAFC
ncbi:MAG: hypothetical protein ACLTOZ_07500 [[Clostridium] leptum]